MPKNAVSHKLTAILYADVAGYSRLTGDDELGTHHRVMSADPEQAFFAEGISEDIITELSKFRSLFVIARNSSFAFKDQRMDVKEVGRKLGVRYMVEGSVRRSGNRVRVTAQLIDAVDDKHLWAERYDRDLEDIFAVQDEVTHAVVSTIEPQLASTERQRARAAARCIRGFRRPRPTDHRCGLPRALCRRSCQGRNTRMSWSRKSRTP